MYLTQKKKKKQLWLQQGFLVTDQKRMVCIPSLELASGGFERKHGEVSRFFLMPLLLLKVRSVLRLWEKITAILPMCCRAHSSVPDTPFPQLYLI